jgi:hypothetical protein
VIEKTKRKRSEHATWSGRKRRRKRLLLTTLKRELRRKKESDLCLS